MHQPIPPAASIEEITLNAWPCLQQVLLGGWILRFANGYTKRANSVNPVYEGRLAAGEKIKRCEQIYRDRQQRTVFKITPFIYPSNLDKLLDETGYQKDSPTSVQTLDLATLSIPAINSSIHYWAEPAEEWVEQYARMNNVAATHVPTLKAILNSIVPSTCFMALSHQSQVVACGLGVFDGYYVGLFDIVTDLAYRQKGFGTNLVLSILNWAKQNGAIKAYLQVMLNNKPALNLYKRLGFKEIYQYWYRIKGRIDGA